MSLTPSKTFELDDLVFAKVKGYPYWPAKITEVKTPGKFYSVEFFGTKEVGNIKTAELFGFHTHKDKFITDKSKRNPLFLKGIIEVLQIAGDAEEQSANDDVATTTPKVKATTNKKTPSVKSPGEFLIKMSVVSLKKMHCCWNYH